MLNPIATTELKRDLCDSIGESDSVLSADLEIK